MGRLRNSRPRPPPNAPLTDSARFPTPFLAGFRMSALDAWAGARRRLLARLAHDRGRQGRAADSHIVKAVRPSLRPSISPAAGDAGDA